MGSRCRSKRLSTQPQMPRGRNRAKASAGAPRPIRYQTPAPPKGGAEGGVGGEEGGWREPQRPGEAGAQRGENEDEALRPADFDADAGRGFLVVADRLDAGAGAAAEQYEQKPQQQR